MRVKETVIIMLSVFENIGHGLRDVGDKIGDGAKAAVEKAVESAANIAQSAMDGIKHATQVAADKTQDVMDNIKEHTVRNDHDAAVKSGK